jgi:DNA-binding response OmpR family regulator
LAGQVLLDRIAYKVALFVQRAGCALTREEILKRVWGYDILVTNRSIDRCITTLRTKIETDPASPKYIVTIRDIGYRFEPTPSEGQNSTHLKDG